MSQATKPTPPKVGSIVRARKVIHVFESGTVVYSDPGTKAHQKNAEGKGWHRSCGPEAWAAWAAG